VNLRAVAWDGRQFVAVGSGTILTSTDGMVGWTSRTSGTSKTLTGIAWNGSELVVVGAGGAVLTSSDGTNCTSRISETSEFLSAVTWNGRRFVAVGDAGTILLSGLPPDPVIEVPFISRFGFQDGGFRIQFTTMPGRTYLVQRSGGLTNWTALAEVPTGANSTEASYVDTSSPSLGPRFYRVVLLP
jgi:hypothetical protein